MFTVAYEMLGSAADAEDVLQETWLITTRQALTRLRTLGRRSAAESWTRQPSG
jgi:DNA-directed RNA polymerase specialized sigma24 family protein